MVPENKMKMYDLKTLSFINHLKWLQVQVLWQVQKCYHHFKCSCMIGDGMRLKWSKDDYVSLWLEGNQKTETQDCGGTFQTNRISVEIIGFIITKSLSLHFSHTHSKCTIWISKWMVINNNSAIKTSCCCTEKRDASTCTFITALAIISWRRDMCHFQRITKTSQPTWGQSQS